MNFKKIKNLKQVPQQNIQVNDDWLNHYINLVDKVVIPYQYDILHDRVEGAEPSYCVQNFVLASKKLRGEEISEDFHGFVFQDSDMAKWLEAAAFSLARTDNPELKKQADEMIDLVAEAQWEDGYINTYFTLSAPKMRWKNLTDCHELYVAGHFIEAAVAYYDATGDRKLLDVMIKFADLIYNTFGYGEGQIQGYPGHEEIELALFKLADATGDHKYIELAKYFIQERGQDRNPNFMIAERSSKDYFEYYPGSKNNPVILDYFQAHAPILEQMHAAGHAVRAVYFYSSLVDLAIAEHDQAFLTKAIQLYEDITQHQMYITGGIGQSGILERFTVPNDLPNDANYSETCASIGLAMFANRLLKATGDARYADTVELCLFNSIASGISLDGTSFFYVNPMEIWSPNCKENTSRNHVKAKRQAWFPCACCPPNIARTYSGLSDYIILRDPDKSEVYINQYIGFSGEVDLRDGTVSIDMHGDYVKEGKMELRISCEQEITLFLRKPLINRQMQVRGSQSEPTTEEANYFVFKLKNGEHQFTINFNHEPQYVMARHDIRADRGLLAVRRGPIIFAAESVDNGDNLASILLCPNNDLQYKDDKETAWPVIIAQGKKESLTNFPQNTLYASTNEVQFKLDNTEVTLIPYALWGNRIEEGADHEMRVWLRRG